MLIAVKKAVTILDGEHEGVIINVRYRARPYEYVDLEIELRQGSDSVVLKAGYPQIISKNSKLGYLLIRFGEELKEGSEIDPDKVLIGQKCKFKTFTEQKDTGKFAKVIPDSVRPSKGVQNELPKL